MTTIIVEVLTTSIFIMVFYTFSYGPLPPLKSLPPLYEFSYPWQYN